MEENLPTNKPYEKFRRYYKSLEPALNKPKNRTYSALILSFLAISLFAWYAIKPTIKTILLLRREIDEKTELNQKMEDKIANLIEAQSAYQNIEAMLPVLEDAIPNNPEALDVVKQIDNLVYEAEATVTAMTVAEVPIVIEENTPAENYQSQEFIISITAEGDYFNLEKMIENLKSMRRITSVKSMSIGSEGQSQLSATPSAVLLNLTVQTTSYYDMN